MLENISSLGKQLSGEETRSRTTVIEVQQPSSQETGIRPLTPNFAEVTELLSNSRFQSISYRSQLTQILQDTRRDVRQVDWRHQVPRLLSEALEHIEVQCAVEGDIAASAREKLDHLPLKSDEAQQVMKLIHLADDCYQHHVELHGLLIGARSVFLDEQLRQCFVSNTSDR